MSIFQTRNKKDKTFISISTSASTNTNNYTTSNMLDNSTSLNSTECSETIWTSNSNEVQKPNFVHIELKTSSLIPISISQEPIDFVLIAQLKNTDVIFVRSTLSTSAEMHNCPRYNQITLVIRFRLKVISITILT